MALKLNMYRRGAIWWTSFTVNKTRYRLSTKKKDKDEAQRKAAELYLKKGGEPAPPPKRPRGVLGNPPTFAVIESYVQHRTDGGCKVGSYRLLEGPLVEKLGPYPVRSVTSEVVATTIRELAAERGWGASTRASALAQLSGALSYALRRGWITEHPIRDGRVAKPGVDNARERWLRPAEIDAVKAKAPPWLQDIIDFAVRTCRRVGEIAALTRRNVHLDVHGRPFLVTEQTKNKKRVRIPLPGEVGELVKRKMVEVKAYAEARAAKGREVDADALPLFPGPRHGDARMSIRRYFKKAVEAAGLPYGRGRDEISFHTLRHYAEFRIMRSEYRGFWELAAATA
jgi:integrase